MTVNVLIGIGGTGAKVVEATLHAAVAGLAADNLIVGLVDQDGSNGNVVRTGQLLNEIVAARTLWRESGRKHVLGGSPLFSTEIKPLSETESVWIPHPDKRANLARIFDRESMAPEERGLFDGLFVDSNDPDEDEQQLPLGEGYRGRPHIGAAAMASRADAEIEFWEKLNTAIDAAAGQKEVRILLAGSVFGGAGASGFPTLARLINKRLAKGRNLRVGGVLMLPYFDFDPPGKEGAAGDDSRMNVALSEELVLQSKSALKHYVDLLETEKLFDQLYLIGWDRPFALGYHSRGANGQANPALAPELLASLAACRFYRSSFKGEVDKVLACARGAANALTWADLPSPGADPDAPFKAFGRLLRFAVAWKHWSPQVRDAKWVARHRSDGWARRQRLHEIDYAATPVDAEVKALDAYCDWFLGWAGAIDIHATNANLDLRLWDTAAFIRPPERPNRPVQVPEALGDRAYEAVYDSIVTTAPGAETPPDTGVLMSRLTNEAEPEHRQAGLGRFVSALHAFADVQPADAGKGG